MANSSWNDWSHLLKEALWVHRTAYRNPLGISPYQIRSNTELTGRSRNATWPMTKPVESKNCSCRSWKSYA
ncbi:hypothetical protein CR513_27012, partial [Mucuna pruriens]